MTIHLDNLEASDLAADAARSDRSEYRDAGRAGGYGDCFRHDWARRGNHLECINCGETIYPGQEA